MNEKNLLSRLLARVKTSASHILTGMGSLTIWPAQKHLVFMKEGEDANERNTRDIASDWRQVGDDIRNAWNESFPPIHVWEPNTGNGTLTLPDGWKPQSHFPATTGLGTRESPFECTHAIDRSPYAVAWMFWARYRLESENRKIYIKVNDWVLRVCKNGVVAENNLSGENIFSKLT